MDLSIVSPAYNEAENLPLFVESVFDQCNQLNIQYEIIIVNDGSVDDSGVVLAMLQKRYSVLSIISFSSCQGKTAALMRGFSQSQGQYTLFLDSDFQHDPCYIPLYWNQRHEADVIVGCRYGKQRWKLFRSMVVFYVSWVMGYPLKDLGTSSLSKTFIFQQMHLIRGQLRFIHLFLYLKGYSLACVPIQIKPRIAGKSAYGFFKVCPTFLTLLSISFYYFLKKLKFLVLGVIGVVSSFFIYILLTYDFFYLKTLLWGYFLMMCIFGIFILRDLRVKTFICNPVDVDQEHCFQHQDEERQLCS